MPAAGLACLLPCHPASHSQPQGTLVFLGRHLSRGAGRFTFFKQWPRACLVMSETLTEKPKFRLTGKSHIPKSCIKNVLFGTTTKQSFKAWGGRYTWFIPYAHCLEALSSHPCSTSSVALHLASECIWGSVLGWYPGCPYSRSLPEPVSIHLPFSSRQPDDLLAWFSHSYDLSGGVGPGAVDSVSSPSPLHWDQNVFMVYKAQAELLKLQSFFFPLLTLSFKDRGCLTPEKCAACFCHCMGTPQGTWSWY